MRHTRDRTNQAGYTAVEMAFATVIAGIFFYGVIGAIDTASKHATEGRKTVKAVGDSYQASTKMVNTIGAGSLNSVGSVAVYDSGGTVVPDQDVNGDPITATGSSVRLTQKGPARLSGGRVVSTDIVTEFRIDKNDVNGDKIKAQLIKVIDPDGAKKVHVLADLARAVEFVKDDRMLHVRIAMVDHDPMRDDGLGFGTQTISSVMTLARNKGWPARIVDMEIPLGDGTQ